MASHSVAVSWGVQATLNGIPNILMFDAESEAYGEDAGQRMNQAVAEMKLQESVSKFNESFGGNRAR